MTGLIWQLITVFLLSSTKMIVGLIWAANSDWPIYLSFSVTFLGGLTGILVYTLLGAKINAWYTRKFTKKSNSTFKRRLMIKLKNKHGLAGIALLTPLLISIPVGCMLSFTQTADTRKIITYQVLSLSFWLVLVFGLKIIFKFRITELL